MHCFYFLLSFSFCSKTLSSSWIQWPPWESLSPPCPRSICFCLRIETTSVQKSCTAVYVVVREWIKAQRVWEFLYRRRRKTQENIKRHWPPDSLAAIYDCVLVSWVLFRDHQQQRHHGLAYKWDASCGLHFCRRQSPWERIQVHRPKRRMPLPCCD